MERLSVLLYHDGLGEGALQMAYGHHCKWRGVECNAEGRVAAVHLVDKGGNLERHSNRRTSRILLPELAALGALERLNLFASVPFTAGMPDEWLQPGAFPRLQRWVGQRAAAARVCSPVLQCARRSRACSPLRAGNACWPASRPCPGPLLRPVP